MLWERIQDAGKRMERARTKLFTNRATQFWGSLGLALDIVEAAKAHLAGATLAPSYEIETMATDQKHIFYNPDFVMTLTEAECMGVIAHEVSHCALRHFARQAGRDSKLWNIAADYELNADLLQAGLTLPEGCLFDPRFNGMAAEQIYNVVARENEQDKDQGKPERHQPGLGGDMLEPTNDDGSPMDSEGKAALDQEWKTRTSQALGAARKAGMMAGGEVPTSLVNVSDHIFATNLVDWRQPLRAFIDRLGSTQSSWSKYNRRALGRGQVLPGQKVIRPSTIGWFIDVSGSMDKAKNRQALIEAQAALDDKACDAIEVIYVDTAIIGSDHYEIGDTIALRDGTGGGTDFGSAMAWASEQDFAAIVFVTDGETGDWGIDPACPVLWAITASQRDTDALNPPYGDKLSLYTV